MTDYTTGDWGVLPSKHRPDASVAAARAVAKADKPAVEAQPLGEAEEVAPQEGAKRLVRRTRMTEIKIRPTRWLWDIRIPVGALTLLAGREGIGKSTVGYDLAAAITRGKLPGDYLGKPRSVVVAATEDSWEHTIAPRLLAAGADPHRILKVDVTTPEGYDAEIVLPADLAALGEIIEQEEVVLILLDPLMSRLNGSLDSHKDGETRQALEPLVNLADKYKASIVGLIHVNKSKGVDPLTSIMGSRAFTAVARTVLFVQKDEDNSENEDARILQVAKSNLGPSGKDNLLFVIETVFVADTDEGEVSSSHIKWLGITDRTVEDAIQASGEGGDKSAVEGALEWLRSWLASSERGGHDEAKAIKKAARGEEHSEPSLHRARRKLALEITYEGTPRKTIWSLPGYAPQGQSHYGSPRKADSATQEAF